MAIANKFPNEQPDPRNPLLSASTGAPESMSMHHLAVCILGTSDEGRKLLSKALTGTPATLTREAGLPSVDMLPRWLENGCDVLIVDLNSDTERALDLVEVACSLNAPITVMVYARQPDQELLVRCMRVGAREFLTDPLSPSGMTEAIVRASARREELRGQKRTLGKLLVFVGAKGGSGVTTIASNFAVALTRESGEGVALVDLNLQLGDAALTLGVKSEFSALDALQNEKRLDSDLVSKLLVRHSSGLQLLAAPDDLVKGDQSELFQPTAHGVLKLMDILRHDFPWVVVDAGCHYGNYARILFDSAEKVYLVTQVSVAELRNANRLISSYFEGSARSRLEVVLNRFESRAGEIDGESIAAALMAPSLSSSWKIPNDFRAVRDAQHSATALVTKDGPITRALTDLAKSAFGKAVVKEKKRLFGMFSI
jgi:pilus assembly protein CpaE